MQFQQGWISQHFVNNDTRQTVEFFNPLILLLDRPLASMQGLVPMMESVAHGSRPILIMAEDVVGEALATLVMNKLKGTLQVCCVKLPANLGHRKDLLQDIAALTGGTAILQELGQDISKLIPSDLGQAEKVVISSTTTRIIGGYGKKEAIAKRIEEIKGLLLQNPTVLEKERLQERLAKLTGGVTILRLGAQTGLELGDKKARCEDACYSTRCALEDGVVPGAGMALARISTMLAPGIVSLALRRPAMQICENAGITNTLDICLQDKRPNIGTNSLTLAVKCDLMAAGIIDPAKVVKSSLRNASSVACQMLLTELVTQVIK